MCCHSGTIYLSNGGAGFYYLSGGDIRFINEEKKITFFIFLGYVLQNGSIDERKVLNNFLINLNML